MAIGGEDGVERKEIEGWGAEPGSCTADGSRRRSKAGTEMGPGLEPVVVEEERSGSSPRLGQGEGLERGETSEAGKRGRGLGCARPKGRG